METNTVKQGLEYLKGEFKLLLDDTTAANTLYLGRARPGSATSDAVWQIRKIDTSSGVGTTWADGDTLYNKVWDNRASLSYN